MMNLASTSSDTNNDKPLNKSFNTDIEHTIQYTRWILQALGIWPMISKNSSATEKYTSKFLIVLCLFAMIYPLVPTLLHTMLKEKNPLARILRLLGPVSACLSSIIKYTLIVIRCKMIKLCFEDMENDWMKVDKEKERAIMIKNARVGRGLTIIACIFMYTGGIFFHIIMPVLKGTKINELNETIRPLVYPGFEIFVDAQKSPTYEIIFCTTFAAALVRYTATIATCNLAAVFVTHACGQIEIVMARLEGLFDDVDEKENNENNEELLQERISSVIQLHVRGLRLSTRIDNVMREICLIEVVAATLIICLLAYLFMTEWSNSGTVAIITYFVFLLSYTFNIFIFCYIGELLMEQCYQVGQSTYSIDWYRLPGKTGLAVVMILAMANYPRKITAGGMMDLSLASFGMIMKTASVYLNMLRTMAE